jgi:hypothetical protein
MARLVRCSSFSGKPRIGILLLEFFKDFASNLLHHLRGDRTRRKHLECAIKNTFDDPETPLAHDERLRDIDTSYRNRHELRLVSGGCVGLTVNNWPCLKISFPKEAGGKINNQPKDKTAHNRQNEIVKSEIPSRLELGSPSNVLASRALDNLAESNVGDIESLAAFRTVQVIPHALIDADCGTVREFRVFGRSVHSSLNSSTNVQALAPLGRG